MSETQKTRDHEAIKRWVEARHGRPAVIAGTEPEGGVLRIDFGSAERDEELAPVSWDEFFRAFDERGLRFAFAEETEDGERSLFCRFVWN